MNDIKHEVTRKPPLPLMIKYIAIMKNKIDELTLREEKLVEALKDIDDMGLSSETDYILEQNRYFRQIARATLSELGINPTNGDV